MRVASVPYNEELRLEDLYSYDILDSNVEKEFDDLLELASDICQCPIAAITFIDSKRQWLKSKIGIPDSQTPRDIAFCAHTILQNEVLQVKDATLDERFCNNPLVTEALLIRFYAGAPIVSSKGYNLGSVCVIDKKPGELTAEQYKALTILSNQVSKLLELRIKNKILEVQGRRQLQDEKILLQKTLDEQEIERTFISVELHENIAQCIAATKFYLEIAESADSNEKDLIRKSKEMLINLLQEVQDLSKLIRPTTLKEVDLKCSLQHLLSNFSKKNNIKSAFVYEAYKDIQAEMAIAIYRIAEEQLNNIKIHAKATEISLNIQVSKSIYLIIKDNGIGIELEKFQRGAGINKILSHVDRYNGTVDLSNGLDKGSELRVMIPLV